MIDEEELTGGSLIHDHHPLHQSDAEIRKNIRKSSSKAEKEKLAEMRGRMYELYAGSVPTVSLVDEVGEDPPGEVQENQSAEVEEEHDSASTLKKKVGNGGRINSFVDFVVLTWRLVRPRGSV